MSITEHVREVDYVASTRPVFNIYCDESSHLENDHRKVMVLGAIWCPLERSREIAVRLREIKHGHGIKSDFEVKWTKVSPAKKQFYLDLVDYFFDEEDLHFRTLVIPDKSELRHEDFSGQDHDTWYYKMFYCLLNALLKSPNSYRIYLDMKDTRSAAKVRKLHEVLANNHGDFSRKMVQRIQVIKSHEVEMLQLADLLIGAVSYANRGLSGSEGKRALVERIQRRSGYNLKQKTAFGENKFNVFVWEPQKPMYEPS